MKVISKIQFTVGAGLILALLSSLPGQLSANDQRDHGPRKTAVAGVGGWNIVPANFTPQFLFVGTDGDTHIRHLPLVGNLNLSGDGVTLNGKLTVDLNGELDSTFSGPLWGEVTITAKVDGVKTLIFEGRATADTVGLVSIGKMKLCGLGAYEGATLDLTFEEIGPGNTDTYNFKGSLRHAPR